MKGSPELHPALAETPPPVDTPEGESPVNAEEGQDEFNTRVTRILEMLDENPEIRDRMLVEMYVTIAEFQAGFREMQENVASMGPRAFFGSMFGRGKGKDKDDEGS